MSTLLIEANKSCIIKVVSINPTSADKRGTFQIITSKKIETYRDNMTEIPVHKINKKKATRNYNAKMVKIHVSAEVTTTGTAADAALT